MLQVTLRLHLERGGWHWGFVKQGIWEITEKLDLINRELGVDTILSPNITAIDTDKKKINTLYKCKGFEHTGGNGGGGTEVTTEKPEIPDKKCRDTHK